VIASYLIRVDMFVCYRVMAIPATVVYFTTYDQLKYKLGYKENDPSTRFIPPVSGSLARGTETPLIISYHLNILFPSVLAATIISPIELIRTKMQSEQLSSAHVGDAVRTRIKHKGPLSLMKGLGPTLLRDVPFSGQSIIRSILLCVILFSCILELIILHCRTFIEFKLEKASNKCLCKSNARD
jgi:hypothetical protein